VKKREGVLFLWWVLGGGGGGGAPLSPKYKAFTLAEVLITLGIIGTVAALTLPGLVKNYQKHVWLTSLKKFYSTFSQGMKIYATNEGDGEFSNTPLFSNVCALSDDFSKPLLDEELKKIFKTIKSCDTHTGYSGSCANITYKALDGDKYASFGSGSTHSYTYVTGDSMVVSVYKFSDLWGSCGRCTHEARCIRAFDIYVDINGKKGPNVMGRDLFVFGVDVNGRLIGGSYANIGNDCLPPYGVNYCQGDGCSHKIINEGWEMNY